MKARLDAFRAVSTTPRISVESSSEDDGHPRPRRKSDKLVRQEGLQQSARPHGFTKASMQHQPVNPAHKYKYALDYLKHQWMSGNTAPMSMSDIERGTGIASLIDAIHLLKPNESQGMRFVF